MTDKPATTYIVSVFEKPHWRYGADHEGTKPKRWRLQRRLARCGIEEITPKPKKR